MFQENPSLIRPDLKPFNVNDPDHPDFNKTRPIIAEEKVYSSNDFQNLMEGKTEVICKNEETLHSTNITALIRDLYKKVYSLEKMVESKVVKE